MKYSKVAAGFAFVISAILLILPRVFPICTGGSLEDPMRCHYTYQAEFIIALLALILSLNLFVLRSAEARLLAGFIIALLGIIIAILPQTWAIGICPPGMGSCHKTTFFVTIAAGLLTIAGSWIIFLNRRGDQEVL